MKEYLTVAKKSVTEKTIEKSRFITTIAPARSVEEARELIEKISKENSFATHNCYAYIIEDADGVKMKFGDDGEPQGTAGLPMLDALKQNELKNVLAVVTRYFGGIKLGAGGLVRAYSSSVSEGIKNSEIVRATPCDVMSFEIDYDFYNTVTRIVSECSAVIKKAEFGNRIQVETIVEKSKSETLSNKITESSKGKVTPDIIGEEYCFIK